MDGLYEVKVKWRRFLHDAATWESISEQENDIQEMLK